jgi:hypothetical protein
MKEGVKEEKVKEVGKIPSGKVKAAKRRGGTHTTTTNWSYQ